MEPRPAGREEAAKRSRARSRARWRLGWASALTLALVLMTTLGGSAPSPPYEASPTDPASQLLELLPLLAEGIELGAWKTLHPTTTLTPYHPRLAYSSFEDWCVRAESPMPLDSTRLLRREAYFYPPDPPDPLGLPVGVSASRLVDGCRLGFLWIEVVDPDPERALALAVDSRAALSSVLGAPDTLTRLLLGRRGLLGRRRPLAGLTSWSSSTRPIEPPGATRVFLAAAGAISGISLQWDRHIAQRVGVDRNRPPWSSLGPRIPEMMALADLGTEAREPFRASFALIDSLLPFSRLLTEEERLDLVEALEGWLAAATNLPPERRAAALVAGDLLLSASMAAARLGDPEGTQVRERLERQGAEFQFSPLENAYGFTHPWLNEAVALDPGGPAGDAAFLRLMEMGFETSVACGDQGGAGFRAVIEQGEKHLRERPGSPREAEIRFLLAEAYSDIVGLANGPAYQDSEDTLYVAEAPHAREHAIQEYRLAFSLAAGSARAADSWENAWRLMAGLTPTRTFFYCVYD